MCVLNPIFSSDSCTERLYKSVYNLCAMNRSSASLCPSILSLCPLLWILPVTVCFAVGVNGWEGHIAKRQAAFLSVCCCGQKPGSAGSTLPSVFLSFLKKENSRDANCRACPGRRAHKEAPGDKCREQGWGIKAGVFFLSFFAFCEQIYQAC